MLRFFCVCLLTFGLSSTAFGQSSPTLKDLIDQANSNNNALSQQLASTTAEVKALRADLAAEKQARLASDEKINQIHVAIVRNQALIPSPPPAVDVVTPTRSIAMSGPGGMMAMQHSSMAGSGACASGSCGSGMGRTRMVARMRSR